MYLYEYVKRAIAHHCRKIPMEAHHIPLPTKITRLNSGIDDSLFIHEKMGTKMTNARTNKKDLESSKKCQQSSLAAYTRVPSQIQVHLQNPNFEDSHMHCSKRLYPLLQKHLASQTEQSIPSSLHGRLYFLKSDYL